MPIRRRQRAASRVRFRILRSLETRREPESDNCRRFGPGFLCSSIRLSGGDEILVFSGLASLGQALCGEEDDNGEAKRCHAAALTLANLLRRRGGGNGRSKTPYVHPMQLPKQNG